MLDRLATLDLQFQDREHIIAAYLYPHADGVALIETGPGSTVPTLQARLAARGLTPADISEVFLTHIHLDHAGAAGHFARHGATIYAHHVGIPHLSSPDRLLASARRIYRDDMDALWGEMHPVPDDQLVALHDGDTVPLGEEDLVALDTPGHASHHMSYVLGDVCFTGDVGGVRMPEERHVELPLAPPEIDLVSWRESLSALRAAADHQGLAHLAPTHFGLYDDIFAHLQRLEAAIEAADEWAAEHLPGWSSGEDALQDAVTAWMRGRASDHGVDDDAWERYELSNPSWMAAPGLQRYWETHTS
jgi:glyoxylase-like metal-dependent hydrolase (beta-lactamase superfamily II)